jgi:hypothetical protein
MERSREATKAVAARELLYAGILARLWPSWVTTPSHPKTNPAFPKLLCVETPTGLLVWRLTADEAEFFDYVAQKENDGRPAGHKEGILYALASEGWPA